MIRSHLAGALAVLFLAGCGAKPDAASVRKADQSPVAGADMAFAAPGWKAGDAAAWEQHMRARTQHQNEYARTR
jgi:hypothetical protein